MINKKKIYFGLFLLLATLAANTVLAAGTSTPSFATTTKPIVKATVATSTKKMATSSEVKKIATSTVATSTVIRATSSQKEIIATTTIESLKTETSPASSSSNAQSAELNKLYGSVQPVSLTASSDLASTTDLASLANATDTAAETNQVNAVNPVVDNGASNVASTDPVEIVKKIGIMASLRLLSSNVLIKMLGSLAIIFLFTAIIFLILSKRYDKRDQ